MHPFTYRNGALHAEDVPLATLAGAVGTPFYCYLRVAISRPRAVYAYARTLPGLSVHGVDMHIGSQITDLQPFDDAFVLLAEFVQVLRADGHIIEHVDLGGGLGIAYRNDNNPPPSAEQYAKIVA